MSHVRHWIEYVPNWRFEPMAFWVHVEQDGRYWGKSGLFTPPAPVAVPHKGYPVLCVEFDGVVLRFSSAAQVWECMRVLRLKPLPTVRRLVAQRAAGGGLNSHWLSRLPSRLKVPKVRDRLVRALEQVWAERALDPLVGLAPPA